MTTTTLIVARAEEASLPAIATIFAESDAGSLPARLGVRRRSLYYFHGLYFHAIESSGEIPDELDAVRGSADFVQINEQLKPFVQPYLATWRSPRDAMARRFYDWTPSTTAGVLT